MSRRGVFAVIAVSLSLLLCGCGNDGMVYVSGTVTFDGQPIEEGRITFRNKDGSGPAYSTPIKQGEYSLPCAPGDMKVEIIASRLIPGKFGTQNGTPEPMGEMYIPKQYNTATTLTAVVNGSSQEIPFDLRSK